MALEFDRRESLPELKKRPIGPPMTGGPMGNCDADEIVDGD